MHGAGGGSTPPHGSNHLNFIIMNVQRLNQFESNYNNQIAPFYVNLAKGDCISYNDSAILREEYNLVISKRDFNLFAKGIKPHRNWSFNQTKKYYGLKGNAQSVAEQINELFEAWTWFKDLYYEH
jgi:hypothetical protein